MKTKYTKLKEQAQSTIGFIIGYLDAVASRSIDKDGKEVMIINAESFRYIKNLFIGEFAIVNQTISQTNDTK